jgi:DNA relaxase NicK
MSLRRNLRARNLVPASEPTATFSAQRIREFQQRSNFNFLSSPDSGSRPSCTRVRLYSKSRASNLSDATWVRIEIDLKKK